MVAYVEYVAGAKKGAIDPADEESALFNSPFKLGNVDPDYTSDRVVESVDAGTGAQALAWTPVVHGAFPVQVGDAIVNYDIKLVKSGADDIYAFYNDADKKFYSDAAYATQITVASGTKAAYVYDNIIIPQNDLPTIKAEIKSIPLLAKARRIAVERYAA